MNQTIIDSKIAVVNEVKAKLESSASSVVVEYRGLSVESFQQRDLRLAEEESVAVNGHLQVVLWQAPARRRHAFVWHCDELCLHQSSGLAFRLTPQQQS